MQSFLTNQKTWLIILTTALLLAMLTIGYQWYQNNQQQKEMSSVRASEQADLLEYAKTVIRNSSDEHVVPYVTACSQSDMRRFETLLARLANLNSEELEEVENYFPACGTYFSRQKLALVQRLRDQWHGYQAVLQLTAQDARETVQSEMLLWEELVNIEAERAQLFDELVRIQGRLIDSQVMSDSAADRNTRLLEEAETVQASLNALSPQAQALLTELAAYEPR